MGRDNALGVLVVDLCEHHKAGMALDERGDVAVVGAHNQVALPMPWHGAILNFRRAFTNGDGVLDLTQFEPLLCCMP